MTTPIHTPVVDRETWLGARLELLDREKELTRLRDELSRQRRALPWVRIEKPYVFATPDGSRSLAELFDGRRQLVVYHFMYGPEWDEGCPSCSFWADSYDGIGVHLAHRDTTLIAVSRAPLKQLLAYRARMGWSFPWVSSLGSDFNIDFHVSFTEEQRQQGATYNFAPADSPGEEAPGLSVFARDDDGAVYHTYSCYARGLDPFNSAYQLLDLTPLGRNEDQLPWSMAWLRRHDQYD
jgi:predicted dithiol-disulfide oxidoreductase (DUF899 family)